MIFVAAANRLPAYRLRTIALSLPFGLLLTGCGSQSAAPTHPAQPLVILTDPASQTIPLGEAATFAVSASGPGLLTYQWSENGNPISGATSSTYTTPATQLSDSGELFTVQVSDTTTSATSTQAKLTIGARSPKPGDLRFQQVDAPSVSLEGTGAYEVSNISIDDGAHTSLLRPQISGSPLELGPADWNCDLDASQDCSWGFFLTNLPSSEPNLAIYYTCDSFEGFNSDLAALPASISVVTSLDIPPGSDTYAIAVTSNPGNTGFDMSQEIVSPTAIQATVAADGLKSRVVSAISFDASGQAHILSYGWSGDQSTAYDVVSFVVPPADVAATATTLAADGYILTAIGGNDTSGYALIGTKVQGDNLPRNLLIVTPKSPPVTAASLNGFAPVALLHYSDPQYPDSANDYVFLYEQ